MRGAALGTLDPLMITSLSPEIVVLPPEWPGASHTGPRPGDLTHFVPQGLALGTPMIMRPYGDTPSPKFYEAQDTIRHPIKSAPLNDDAGGVIYFSGYVDSDDLQKALAVMAVRCAATNYAVFTAQSQDPCGDNYLEQMRIVQTGALSHFYGAPGDALPQQSLDIGAAIARFITWQKWKWERDPHGPGLAGTMGGDGDWAKERLAFGLVVENSYWGIYRIWSRAWLVTK